MKKRVMKIAAVVLMFAGTFAITAPAALGARAIGNQDCNDLCETSTEFHCLLTYGDGQQVICVNMQVKGTGPVITAIN